MRKIFIIPLILIPLFLFSQEPKLFFGFKSPHSVYVDINFQYKKDARFGASIAYYIPYFNRMYYYAGGIIPIEFVVHGLNQSGFSLGINYGLLSYYKEGKWHTFQIEYQRLKSGDYVYDEGKFAGTTESDYAEFTEKYNNISIIYGIRKGLGEKQRFEFFYEFGFTLRFKERHYDIEGRYSEKVLSNRIENKLDALPLGRIGFNFRIF